MLYVCFHQLMIELRYDMSWISLEFYLVHGMFVEMFGFDWLDVRKSVYYIRNVALYEAVVLISGIAAALLIKLLMKPVRHLTGKAGRKG